MKAYLVLTAILFAVIAVAHVLRLAYQWPVQLAGWQVPMWISWLGAAVPAALSAWAFSLAMRKPS